MNATCIEQHMDPSDLRMNYACVMLAQCSEMSAHNPETQCLLVFRDLSKAA